MAEKAYTVTLARDVQDLIPEFIENRRRELQALRGALAAGRYDQLSELGHRMRGIGTSYGFDRVSILGGEIEEHARIADREGLAARIAEYAEYLARVKVVYE
jgi:HPt (histidine-containing phosphotransfer) domain-containing protein